MGHNIIISAETEVPEGVEEQIKTVISAALAAEGVELPCEINVLLTDDEGIHQINLDMRQVDRPTDVLSFPMFDLAPGEHPGEEDADPATGLVPLGDMCISLERAAAQAEFVLCLYDPSSHKRKDYLQKACDILLEAKAPETPCGYVSQIGREGEAHTILTLEELREAQVDMFTTVFVGNSQTQVIGGRLVTPRGYLQR